MTTLECEPTPISLSASVTLTVNSICRPSTLRHFGLPADQAANRGRREVAHIDGGADRALAGIEISPDRVEGGVFHDHDHHGSG
jgi:hypothetical protein